MHWQYDHLNASFSLISLSLSPFIPPSQLSLSLSLTLSSHQSVCMGRFLLYHCKYEHILIYTQHHNDLTIWSFECILFPHLSLSLFFYPSLPTVSLSLSSPVSLCMRSFELYHCKHEHILIYTQHHNDLTTWSLVKLLHRMTARRRGLLHSSAAVHRKCHASQRLYTWRHST